MVSIILPTVQEWQGDKGGISDHAGGCCVPLW